jgi:hypothetical protein
MAQVTGNHEKMARLQFQRLAVSACPTRMKGISGLALDNAKNSYPGNYPNRARLGLD